MAEFDPSQNPKKTSPSFPSEYVRLEAGLIAKPDTKESPGDLTVQPDDPRTLLIFSESVEKCDETSKSLREGFGSSAVIIPCMNTGDAIKWLNKGSIDLMLCGRNSTLNQNERNSFSPFNSSDSFYGAALVLIRKSDPSLISWIQIPEHLHHLSVAIAILNEEP